MRYATPADLDFARTRGATERRARMITRAGKRYMALTWELAGDSGNVFVVMTSDASTFLTEEEACALGIQWDARKLIISQLVNFLASVMPYNRNGAKKRNEA